MAALLAVCRSYSFAWVALTYVCLILFGNAIGYFAGSSGYLLYITVCVALVVFVHWRVSAEKKFWLNLYEGQVFRRIDLVHFTCWCFFVYLCLQSPVFHSGSGAEVAYFAVKIGLLIYLLFALSSNRARFTTLPALFILYAFLVDSLIISLVNNGVAKSPTEWFPIWESCFFLIVCRYLPFGGTNNQLLDRYLIVLFVAGHMANYWAAGFAKFNLDGGPASWVLTNETFSTLRRADLWGLGVPYADWLLRLEGLSLIEFVGNFFVYIGQLMSSVVLLFPVLLAPLTIFYDFFHLLVGLTAGVWFYKWAFVNVLIYIYKREVLSAIRSLGIMNRVLASAVIVSAYYYSSVAPLGWYETRQGTLIKAYASLEDGSVMPLHPQFFGSGSFSILNFQMASFDTTLPFTQFAAPSTHLKEKAGACDLQPASNPEHMESRSVLTDFVQRFFPERGAISEFALSIQPFHLLVPNYSALHSVRDIDNENIESFRLDLVMYCLDEDYGVSSESVLDSYVIRRKE